MQPLKYILLCLSVTGFLSGCKTADSFNAKDLTPLSDLKIVSDDRITIAKDGKAFVSIVIDDNPRNLTVARDLAAAIRAISGARPCIVRELNGQPAKVGKGLFIGDLSEPKALGLSSDVTHPEGFRVVAVDGSIYFLGRSDYAVYDWCERELGVRCYWYDKAGDEVSVVKRSTIEARYVDYSDAPMYAKRICGGCSNQRWGRFAKSGSSHLGGVKVHAPHKWHEDEELVATHPEIFSKTPDGRRAASPMLCYGNPATLEYYERRIDDEIDGVRDSGGIVDVARKVITVSPWDAAYNCRCEHCTALYDYSLGEYGYASPVVWGHFLKKLAKWAKERHPDYLISFLPYWTMCEVPKDLDLSEEGNCEAEVCVMPGIALLKDDRRKEKEERIIRDWTRVTGRKAILWHYTCWPAEYTVAPYLFGATARRHYIDMHDAVDGVFICGGGEVPRLSLMYYVMMRCMWNPDIDVDAVYDGFAQRMFGPAAHPMRRLIELQERGWSENWPTIKLAYGNIYGYSYPPWVVREMKQCIARAERLASGDPLSLRRVRRYAEPFARFFDEAEFVSSGAPESPLSMTASVRPPRIDGRINESCWSEQAAGRFVVACGRDFNTPPAFGTDVMATYSDEGVAFAFRCDEPSMDDMPDDVAQGDEIHQDALCAIIEIHGAYHEVSVDAKGRVCRYVDNMPQPSDGIEAAVGVSQDGWTVEVQIPFSLLGVDAKEALFAGEWRGNFVRWRTRKKPGRSEWSRLSTRKSPLDKDINAFVQFLP